MRYRLVVVTHGDAPHLDATVESFVAYVAIPPVELVTVVDGPGRLPPNGPAGLLRWRIYQHPKQLGFCDAMLTGWAAATEPGADYVFWLENDFLIERDLPLAAFASVLDADPSVAQMALMRQAVNSTEREAGGLYESRRGDYENRLAWNQLPWLAHSAYFTTNPSLMRRDFMVSNPWPDYPSECEGRFGIDLVDRGYHFGVWGDGRPWCEHVGVRDGTGY